MNLSIIASLNGSHQMKGNDELISVVRSRAKLKRKWVKLKGNDAVSNMKTFGLDGDQRDTRHFVSDSTARILEEVTLSLATRPDPDESFLDKTTRQPTAKKGGGNSDPGMGGFFGPGGGFNIPGFGPGPGWGNGGLGGGYGSGYGGPNGGSSKGGIIRPTVVCKEKGPCYMKKLTCPAKCFTSYHRSGKGYGGGGGGGGCTMDCKKKCIAYC
ncbi:hypothetical protein BUALT_Bualt03G0058600 [Buddleja alternifolia]|uniref:Uncharacterized protein n=1 Tax=Buddleja alternifolia TaxID=168488 RepID=A0AAV6XZK1_9LAMI|nr:hypothetical protein BUALT_Bualt03G0058600 [Buddleja alternifolia]